MEETNTILNEELINEAMLGNQEALSDLYKLSYNNVYLTIHTLIKDEDASLDILQDTYIKAFASLSQLKKASGFKSWIKRIAHNKAVDYLRKQKPIMFSQMSNEEDENIDFEDDDLSSVPDVVIDQQETKNLIKEILDSLPEDQRLVVGMHYYEDISVKEIAASLDISENTVKSRLKYGREKIELKVKELEKKGIKLYSLAPIPFLALLFKNQDIHAMQVPSKTILKNVLTSSHLSSSASSAAGHAASSAIKKGTIEIAGKTITTKALIATTAIIIGTGGTAAYVYNQNQKPKTIEEEIAQIVGDNDNIEEDVPEKKKESANELMSFYVYEGTYTSDNYELSISPLDESHEVITITTLDKSYPDLTYLAEVDENDDAKLVADVSEESTLSLTYNEDDDSIQLTPSARFTAKSGRDLTATLYRKSEKFLENNSQMDFWIGKFHDNDHNENMEIAYDDEHQLVFTNGGKSFITYNWIIVNNVIYTHMDDSIIVLEINRTSFSMHPYNNYDDIRTFEKIN